MPKRFVIVTVVVTVFLGLLVGFRNTTAAVALDPVAVRAAAVAAGLQSLRNVGVPQINNIGDFLNPGPGARSAAVVMGTALFWDMQVGSDGIQSCASCHFSAGADSRSKNQLSPGFLAAVQDTAFGNSAITGVGGFPGFGPNYQLTGDDFSFHQLTDPQREDFNHRVVVKDTNDVTSSQGVFKANFRGIVPGQAADNGTAVADPVFNVGGVNVRQVPPRNAPAVINAVFNVDNFWDGRARSQFNGVNPFGPLDANATVLVNEDGTLQERTVVIPNSSLASQAVGPPLSDVEMSFAGRTFPDVGKKMLAARPLALQKVHVNDGVLGSFSRNGQGLNGLTFNTYADLVRTVFQSKYWDSNRIITFNPNGSRVFHEPTSNVTGYSQMEANFSLIFGLAVQAYESTLVSDRTRFDLFMEGDNVVLTQDELAGLLIFINKGTPAQAANPIFTGISQGSCTSCHGGPLFSDSTYPGMGAEGPIELEVAPLLIDGTIRVGTELVLLDNGYYNIGIRPTSEDIGRGGSVLGKPLSASRQALAGIPFAPRLPANVPPNTRVMVDGAFKVPTMRNVELTGPYFHNGCQRTLRQVLDFYHRHTDFGDTNIANLDSPLANVKLDGRINAAGRDLDADQLVKFLLTLTDERVRAEMSPFDHPQLFVPNGHPGDRNGITQFDLVNGVKQAKDTLLEVPAVARDGRETLGLPLLKPFLGGGGLQGTVIRLRPGWNTLSTPIRLHSTMDTWGEFAASARLSYQAAAQPPSLPHYFFGTVKIDSVDAPAGTRIEARVPGVLNGTFNPIVTTEAGRYGSADPAANVPRLLVQGNIADGATIEFFVNGVKANETAAWHSGQTQMLNLTAGTAPAPTTPPGVVTDNATGITGSSAVLNGILTGLGTATTVSVFFEYGTTTGYGSTTAAQPKTTAGSFSAVIEGLPPGTLFHFRAKADGGAHGVATDADVTFTTTAATTTPPAVVTPDATGVTATSAVLNGNLTSAGTAASVDVSFEWGTAAGGPYPGVTPAESRAFAGTFSASVSGLTPATTYFFRAKASGAHGAAFGFESSFLTLAAPVGGGGGGGTAPPPPVAVTIAGGSGKVKIDGGGNVLEETRVESADGRVKLTIGRGTKALKKDGRPLDTIAGDAVARDKVPGLPQGRALLGEAVNFGPDGATFNPPLVLTMGYGGETLPPGVTADRLAIAFWNGGGWEVVGGKADPATMTVTAPVSHFTLFAVTYWAAGYPPACWREESSFAVRRRKNTCLFVGRVL